jgi:hypothetical protein
VEPHVAGHGPTRRHLLLRQPALSARSVPREQETWTRPTARCVLSLTPWRSYGSPG